MIEVSHLSKSYGSRPAVQDLSFTVPDGQIYGLLGPNGAGKSTIMNILTGYLAPTEGEVKVAGFRLPEQAQQAKACVGYLPEQPPLYPEMTVQEYLDFVAELKGVKRAQRKQQVLAAAHRTGLEEVLPRVIRSLSKGYRQRVGIAQALLGSPQLIILDEPTVGLDPAQVIEIRNLIRELGKAHTVILSSHILSEVQAVCQQVLILSKGRLVAVGSPEELGETLNPGSRLRATAQGYLAPTEGEVKVAGFRLPEQAQQAKACVGYLPEQPPLYPEMTVQEYLDFVAELKGVKRAQRKQQVLAAAHRTGLEEVLPRVIRSLSKGYRQRVGIAQALLGSPQLIILDEPTVGLDPAQVIEIRNLIRELGKAHTVILSSHILSEVQAVCQQVLILSKGRLVAVGSPEELGETLNPGSRLRATAQGEPDTVLAAVRSVPGICKVELESAADGQVTFTAESEDAADRRAAVSRALTEAGCTVLALAAENRSLEEVFLALTEKTPEQNTSAEGEEN